MKIIVGQFGQSYGIKGWLKVHSLTEPPENILRYLPWQAQLQNAWRLVTVTASKLQGKQILVKLAECDSPETAKIYTNSPIAVLREQLPKLAAEEYYWNDLVGLTVMNQDGVNFGTIQSLFATGSNDVLVIEGERRRLLPYTQEVIISVDLADKIMRVNWDADF